MPPPTNAKAHAAILAFLDDGVTRSFGELREAVPRLSDSAVRSIVHRLLTNGEIDSVPMSEGSRFVCYRRSESRRPFLLGQFMRKAFLPVEGVGA
jgi:hypothetical protein